MWILCVKAQHACTLCPTFQRRRTRPSHSNKLKLWIVSGAGLFFSFFSRASANKPKRSSLSVNCMGPDEQLWVPMTQVWLRATEGCREDYRGGYKVVLGEIRDTEETETWNKKVENWSALRHFKGNFMVLRFSGGVVHRKDAGETKIMTQKRVCAFTSAVFRTSRFETVSSSEEALNLALIRWEFINRNRSMIRHEESKCKGERFVVNSRAPASDYFHLHLVVWPIKLSEKVEKYPKPNFKEPD